MGKAEHVLLARDGGGGGGGEKIQNYHYFYFSVVLVVSFRLFRWFRLFHSGGFVPVVLFQCSGF